MKTYQIVSVSMLSAIAVVFQMIHGVVGIETGFGMTVDIVGVPMMLAFFMFGLESALYTAAVTALALTLISPESWLGASMKFAATVPMFIVPAYYIMLEKGKRGKIIGSIGLGALTILAAFLISIYTNIYAQLAISHKILLGLLPIASIALFAWGLGKVWEKKKPEGDWNALASWKKAGALMLFAIAARGAAMVIANYYFAGPLFFGMSTGEMLKAIPWQLIFGWNAIQGALEYTAAWIIAYRFKIAEKYGKW